MLTFENIKNVRFSRKLLGGYKSSDVDKFVDDIRVLISDVIEENLKLKKELDSSKEEIKKTIEDDRAIRRAIANSQKIADAAVIDAGVRSKYILKDAADRAVKLITISKKDAQKKLDISKQLYKYYSDFKAKLTENFKQQLEFLENLNFENTEELEKHLSLMNFDENFFKDNEEIIRFYEETENFVIPNIKKYNLKEELTSV